MTAPAGRADRDAASGHGSWEHGGVTTSPAPTAGPAGAGAATGRSASRASATSRSGPLDGRYRQAVAPLAQHLSEAALNRERLRVEVEWLVHLAATRAVPGLRELTADEVALLRAVPARLRRGGRRASSPRSSASRCTTSRRSSTCSSGASRAPSLADVAEYLHLVLHQ